MSHGIFLTQILLVSCGIKMKTVHHVVVFERVTDRGDKVFTIVRRTDDDHGTRIMSSYDGYQITIDKR